jgi:hypothetical protein
MYKLELLLFDIDAKKAKTVKTLHDEFTEACGAAYEAEDDADTTVLRWTVYDLESKAPNKVCAHDDY